MVLTHLVFYSFLNGAGGTPPTFGGTTTFPPFYLFDGFTSGDVTPPTTTPPTGSGGGRYLPAPGDYGGCERKIKALEKQHKAVERRIKKLEAKIEEKKADFESAIMLQSLITQLEKLQRQLIALYLALQRIEEDEEMLMMYCVSKWLH